MFENNHLQYFARNQKIYVHLFSYLCLTLNVKIDTTNIYLSMKGSIFLVYKSLETKFPNIYICKLISTVL